MANKYFTMQELQSMQFYELPNRIYKAILNDIKNTLGILTNRIIEIINHANVMQLDQYCNIWKYISIIA
jgi:hypothetical protein